MEPAQRAEATEQQAITEGREIIERHGRDNWRLGELAAELHAAGRTDQQIADLWGCSQGWVNQCRRIHERFGLIPVVLKYRCAWLNWREMLTWADAEDMLEWAFEQNTNFREMAAYRRLQHGEDIRKPASDPAPAITISAPEPDPPIVRPTEPEPDIVQKQAKTEPKQPKTEPKQPNTVSAVPADVLTAVKDSVNALKAVAIHANQADRPKIAKALRKLADEFDPPKKKTRFTAPTVDEVAAYCHDRGNSVDPEAFWDYYESQGWKKANGRTLEKWRSAVHTWEKKENGSVTNNNSGRWKSRAEHREQANADAFTAVFGPAEGTSDIVLDEGTNRLHAPPAEDVGGSAEDLPF